MGRGGYLGGSTLIRPGSDWFSGVSREPPTGKPRKKATKVSTNFCNPEEHAFLRSVAASRARNKVLPETPLGMNIEVADRIRRAGGVLPWAISRREWQSMLATLRNEHRKPVKSKEKSTSVSSRSELDRKIEGLRTGLIRAILLAERNGQAMPPIPRKLRGQLADVTHSPATLVAWAEANKSKLDAKTLRKTTPLVRDKETLGFVKAIASAETNGQSIPNVPRGIRAAIDGEITKAGGIKQWAAAHPSYTEFYDAAKRKREAKAARRAGQGSTSPMTVVTTITKIAAAPEKILKNGLSRHDELALEKSIIEAVLPPGKQLTPFEVKSAQNSTIAILRVDAKRRFSTKELLPLDRYPSHVAIANRVSDKLQMSRGSLRR